MGPMMAVIEVKDAEKSAGKPDFFMAFRLMAPTEAVSATEEPETPANTMEERMFTWAIPPGK